MGTLETVLILGVVLVGGYYVLTSGVLNNLGQGVGATPVGTEGTILDELGGGWEKKGCCRCRPGASNQIECKQGSKGQVFISNQDDLEAALEECADNCVETGEEEHQKLKAISENCYKHTETGMHCWREDVGSPLVCVKGDCDDAERESEETQGGTQAPTPESRKTCNESDKCNWNPGGKNKKCKCGCIGDSWNIGHNTPCSQCETACRARRRMKKYSNVGYTGGYTSGLSDSLKFAMLGRQAARAYVAVPESMDYAYSPNNYDPFQLETGSMRISGV